MQTRSVVAALLLAVVLAARTGHAQAPPDDAGRRAVSLERELMSPFCPGLTLYSCTSPSAAEWRRDIHSMVRSGLDDTEIRARLQARVPGFDLTGRPAGNRSWTLPVAAGVLATLLLAIAAYRLRPRRRAAAVPEDDETEPEEDALDARIDEALEELDAA